MRDGHVVIEIEPVEHGFESIELPVDPHDGAQLPVGVGDEGCGSGARIDLPYVRRHIFVSAGRGSLGRINGVGVESRIELSLESIETLVAEIECPVAIESERNVRIGSQTGGSAAASDRSRIAGRKIHGIEIVAEVGHIEISIGPLQDRRH